MANAEAASAAAVPRYAPDDPTLPKPWKGLIDGSTGIIYYWNPETNITQYEKPAGAVPPLPSSVPPVDIASQSAPQHGQTGEASQYQQHYMNQLSQQQAQFQSSLSGHSGQVAQQSQQQPSPILPTGQQGSHSVQQGSHLAQQYTHFGQGMHERGSQVGQGPMQQGQVTQQQYGQQIGQLAGQHMLQQKGSHVAQQPMQHPSQLGPQAPQQQSPPVGQSQNHHFMPQQMHYAPYHQPMHPHGQPNTQSHSQHIPQGQHFSYQQDSRNGLPHRDDSDYAKINQPGMPLSQADQNARGVGQSPPSMSSSRPALQGSPLAGQPQSYGSSGHMHQPPSSMKLQENRNDMFHPQHTSKFQNQMGQSMMHVQQHGPSPVRRNMGYDENQQAKAGQDFRFNAEIEPPAMASHRPNLAPIPVARNQQDMRMGAFPHQNTPSGRDGSLNPGASHGMHNMLNHANVDGPMPNQAYMRPSPMMPGPSDAINVASVEAYRLKHEVTATGEDVPAPYMTFEAAGFSPEILREVRYLLQWGAYVVRCTAMHSLLACNKYSCECCTMDFGAFIHITTNLHSAGFASPTPIQAQTWPIARQHKDIVAVAKTGSGKTLGYLMPAFMHLKERRNNPRYGPTVLVLAPTRELATQIQAEANKFGCSSRVNCACLSGGASKGLQLDDLRRGADIVVATPGRLNDILDSKHIDLRQVSLLVLDEADRMLDMGFEPQIRKVVNEIPPRRQTLMYTATWPKEVRKIAGDLLHNPVQVNIGSVDELAANKSITQYIEVVPQMQKQRRLEQILSAQERGSKVIIFCSTKRMCDDLARNIRRNFSTAVIHGDKNQGERDHVLNQFRSGESPILVATDVAARGLDVKDIRVVINYDFPTGIEDYVHRIGRTGRAGSTGVAYTFFSEQDWKHASDLVKVLEGAEQPVPPEVRDMALRGGPPFGRSGMNNRFEPGPGFGGSRWDSGGRGGGMRDGGFGGGRDGMRDGDFGGRGGMRDGGFGFRGGPRDGGFPGRGMRDNAPMNSRGGRNDFGGRGNHGRGFGPPGGGYGGRPRDDYGSNDRLNSRDGFGRGRGRGRFDNRRDGPGRSRGRSSSPEKVSTWDHSRSGSRSRSRSRSRSYSRSRSPRRSYSRGRSPRRSYSRSRSPRRSYSRSRSRSYDRSRGRSRSRSYERHERPSRRASGFDKLPETVALEQKDLTAPVAVPPEEPLVPAIGSDANENLISKEERLEDKELPVVSGEEVQADQVASEV